MINVSTQKIGRPLIAILSLVFFVFAGNTAFADVVDAQNVFNSQETFTQSSKQGVFQYLGFGLSGALGSVTLYGQHVSGSGYHTITIGHCTDYTSTTTCESTMANDVSTSTLVSFSSTPAPLTQDLSSASFTFDPSKYYRMAVGFNDTGESDILFGTTATNTVAFPTQCSFISYYSNCTTFGQIFFFINTQVVSFAGIPGFGTTTIITTSTTPAISCSSWLDLVCQMGNMLSFLLRPSQSSFDNFTNIKDSIKNKPPMGYFTSAASSITGISGTSSPAFVLATSSPMMTYIFTPLRTGLLWVIGFFSLLAIYKRLTHITL